MFKNNKYFIKFSIYYRLCKTTRDVNECVLWIKRDVSVGTCRRYMHICFSRMACDEYENFYLAEQETVQHGTLIQWWHKYIFQFSSLSMYLPELLKCSFNVAHIENHKKILFSL